jgi:hypothetical protein
MNRPGDTLEAMMNRMKEFYVSAELAGFEDFVIDNGIHIKTAYQFLDFHTRYDYFQYQGYLSPNIKDYKDKLLEQKVNGMI